MIDAWLYMIRTEITHIFLLSRNRHNLLIFTSRYRKLNTAYSYIGEVDYETSHIISTIDIKYILYVD